MKELSAKQTYLNLLPNLDVNFPFACELDEDSRRICMDFLVSQTKLPAVFFPESDIVVSPYGICSRQMFEILKERYSNYEFPKESEVKPEMKKTTMKKAAKKKTKSASKKKC